MAQRIPRRISQLIDGSPAARAAAGELVQVVGYSINGLPSPEVQAQIADRLAKGWPEFAIVWNYLGEQAAAPAEPVTIDSMVTLASLSETILVGRVSLEALAGVSLATVADLVGVAAPDVVTGSPIGSQLDAVGILTIDGFAGSAALSEMTIINLANITADVAQGAAAAATTCLVGVLPLSPVSGSATLTEMQLISLAALTADLMSGAASVSDVTLVGSVAADPLVDASAAITVGVSGVLTGEAVTGAATGIGGDPLGIIAPLSCSGNSSAQEIQVVGVTSPEAGAGASSVGAAQLSGTITAAATAGNPSTQAAQLVGVIAAASAFGAATVPEAGLAAAATLPTQVTGLTASNSPAQATLSWSPVSGATSYNVYYSIANNSSGATKLAAATTDTSYTVNGPLSAGTTYYFWVSASNSVGEGALSSAASATAAATDYFGSSDEGWILSTNGTMTTSRPTNSHNGGASLMAHLGTMYWDEADAYFYSSLLMDKFVTVSDGNLSFDYKIDSGPSNPTVQIMVASDTNSAFNSNTLAADGLWHSIALPTGFAGNRVQITINPDEGNPCAADATINVYLDNIVVP